MGGQVADVQIVRHGQSEQVAQRLTPDKVRAFAAELERTGNISAAADLVGLSRNAAYDLRCRDPEFDAACQQALERATDRLERKVRARAENGSKRGVWYKGELVGHEREHHDTLSIFMLKAHRPEVYRPDVAVQVGIGLSQESIVKLSDAELELVVARQLKREGAINADTLNVVKDVARLSNDVHNATESKAQAQGPDRARAGGGRLTTAARKGPKHQHGKPVKRRIKNQTKK